MNTINPVLIVATSSGEIVVREVVGSISEAPSSNPASFVLRLTWWADAAQLSTTELISASADRPADRGLLEKLAQRAWASGDIEGAQRYLQRGRAERGRYSSS